MKKVILTLLKQPWFYILGVELLLIFILFPLVDNPGRLYYFFPESWYDAWEEFAVIDLEKWLYFCALFLFLFTSTLTFIMLLHSKCKGFRKIKIVVFYSFLALIALGTLMPKLGVAREKSKRISCASNLKQINFALIQYAEDNKSNLPPVLKTLTDGDYLTDKNIFRCPSRKRPNPEFSDYIYYGAKRTLRAKPPFLLIKDRDKNHPGKYCNLLMSNGQIIQQANPAN